MEDAEGASFAEPIGDATATGCSMSARDALVWEQAGSHATRSRAKGAFRAKVNDCEANLFAVMRGPFPIGVRIK